MDIAESAALEAGDLLIRGFRAGGQVSRKGRFDLVTEFDLKSEALIRRRLGDAFPSHRIVGEEGDETGQGELVWYVDPIDGTINFAHGHAYFAISIALYREGQGLAAVIHAPQKEQTWKAALGHGAFRDGEPCSVSGRTALDEALCSTGFPSDLDAAAETNEAEFGAFLRRACDVRHCGSAALDLALVGDGTYDFFWERGLGPWDIAAGALIVAEAGGQVSHYDGAAHDPRSGEVVATNGLLHVPVLDTLAEASGSR
jgi:myo-inositol-1(or 4)-monophosphatase